jgi:hypothetical protein
MNITRINDLIDTKTDSIVNTLLVLLVIMIGVGGVSLLLGLSFISTLLLNSTSS